MIRFCAIKNSSTCTAPANRIAIFRCVRFLGDQILVSYSSLQQLFFAPATILRSSNYSLLQQLNLRKLVCVVGGIPRAAQAKNKRHKRFFVSTLTDDLDSLAISAVSGLACGAVPLNFNTHIAQYLVTIFGNYFVLSTGPVSIPSPPRFGKICNHEPPFNSLPSFIGTRQ